MIKKKIIGLIICMLFIVSGISSAYSAENNPPNVPNSPHPEDGAIDIGKKTHLSWTGGDPDPGDKAFYDLFFGTDVNPGLIASDLQMPNYKPDTLNNFTQYFWYVVAKDENGASTTGLLWSFTTNDCECDPPNKPSGPTRVRNRHRYNYTTKTQNQNQGGYYYNFSWGDGNHTGWLGPYQHNEKVRAEHQWEELGMYQVQARYRFENGRQDNYETGWSEPLIVEVSTNNPNNEPPNIPLINGPTSGKPGIEYPYTFSTIDPDGDDVYYVVSWGCCGSETHTYGPYESGETVEISHSWAEQGTFTITVFAEDVYESESEPVTLQVTMPRYKTFNFPVISKIFEKIFSIFPMLEILLNLF